MNIVYQIRNKLTNQFLIGSTSQIHIRKNNHLSSLRYNRHDNKYLQRAYNKYGSDVFIFEILFEYHTIKEAINKEQEILDLYCGNPKYCYNINPRADKGGSFIGYKHSTYTKNKISQSLINRGCKKGKNNPCYGRIGSKNPRSILTEWQVRIIRRCFTLDISNTFIANIFNVKQPAISKIKNGHRWPKRGTL